MLLLNYKPLRRYRIYRIIDNDTIDPKMETTFIFNGDTSTFKSMKDAEKAMFETADWMQKGEIYTILPIYEIREVVQEIHDYDPNTLRLVNKRRNTPTSSN